MNEDHPNLVEDIFQQAADLSEDQRQQFLNEHCGSNKALRSEVELLLRHEAQATPAFLAGRVPSEKPGTMIGRYKILKPLGEGAYGDVYLSEQTGSLRRQVALKIIKLGMDTRHVVARFEAERQALALMDHPHIAKVFDAGATDTGRPYFAMEYVPGVSITKYCDQEKLDTDDRLRLFSQVCDAVHHAHQKGIIHRDLKPSNILVEVLGANAIPKVIDFGIAKATGFSLTERTLYTEEGQLIGTPEYMSPEQAEMSPLNVDTRTDIYSLGVVLYELLAGAPPFDPKTLRRGTIQEIQRRIREEEPPTPSTRLSHLGDEAGEAAKHRRVDLAALRRHLKGDLDWITMKAMAKERSRRYPSASELAADIERHLKNEPVLAGPPSAAYRLNKFTRRNRTGVIAGAVVAGALVVATVVSIGFGLSEAEQREIADERAHELETVVSFQASMLSDVDPGTMGRSIIANLRQSAESSLLEAGLEPAQSAELLATFDRVIGSVNATNLALQTLDEHVLARAADAIGSSFADQPLTEASLRQTLADTYLKLGLLEEAVPHQEQALEIRRRRLGDEHPDTLTSINNMGLLLRWQGQQVGDLAEAEKYIREALEGRRRVLGDEHPDTLTSITSMGFVLMFRGRLAEAELYHREALEGRRRVLGDEHQDTLQSIYGLGAVLQRQGRLAEAEPYCREAMEGQRRVLGDEHPSTLLSINILSWTLQQLGRLAEAEPYCREAFEVRRRVLGDEHPLTLFSINNMGVLLQRQDHLAEAEKYFRWALEARRRLLGDEHPDTLVSISNMGFLLQSQGHLAEAEPAHREALEGNRRMLGDEHPETLISISRMGSLLQAQGNLAEAEPYCREAMEGFRRVLGDEHRRTLWSIIDMSFLLHQQGRLAEAEPLRREAMEGFRRVLGDEHPNTLLSINSLGFLLLQQGRLAEAEPYCREALDARRRVLGDEHPHTRLSINIMVELLNAQTRYADAEHLVRENLPGNIRMRDEDHLHTAEARSLLGAALTGLERYEEAETHLLEGYAGLDASPQGWWRTHNLARSIERLVYLYDAWGNPEKAAEWRARLAGEEGSNEQEAPR